MPLPLLDSSLSLIVMVAKLERKSLPELPSPPGVLLSRMPKVTWRVLGPP